MKDDWFEKWGLPIGFIVIVAAVVAAIVFMISCGCEALH